MTAMRKRENHDELVADVAAEYRELGFQVEVEPSSALLPQFLGQFRPDLLAHKDGEHVIVEVKNADSLKGDTHLKAVAAEVEKHAGWRLDMVVFRGRAKQHPVESAPIDYDITSRLNSADLVLKAGDYAGALLLTWSAAEAALQWLARQEDIDTTRKSPRFIVKSLYSLGAINWGQFQVLDKAVTFRNSAVHGMKTRGVTKKFVQNLIELVRALADALPPKARPA